MIGRHLHTMQCRPIIYEPGNGHISKGEQSMGKYDELFYEFQPEETHWGDWIHSPQAYFRGSKDIPGANLNCGFQVIVKEVELEKEPHFHREEEYLFFMGATFPDVFYSWDAEVEFYLGESLNAMERITITEPTCVRLPAGMWHSPLTFKRVTKPVFFQAAFQHGSFGTVKQVTTETGGKLFVYSGDECRPCVKDAAKECSFCGACFKEAPAVQPYWTVSGDLTEKHKDLVLALVKEETEWGDWCPSPQTYFRGQTYMKDAQYHVGFQVFALDNDMEGAHFHQGRDEYIFFLGADPMNIFDFECDIDFAIGEHPDHMEHHHITKPAVVRIPPNMWHCPILFRNMKKPLIFQAAWQHGVWGTINRMQTKSGEWLYPYTGDNVRYCKYHPERLCTICGRCFKHAVAKGVEDGEDLTIEKHPFIPDV